MGKHWGKVGFGPGRGPRKTGEMVGLESHLFMLNLGRRSLEKKEMGLTVVWVRPASHKGRPDEKTRERLLKAPSSPFSLREEGG